MGGGHPTSDKQKFDLSQKNVYYQTGFEFACLGGHTKIVEMLIDVSETLKLDLTSKNIHGLSGYELALENQKVDVITLIKAKMPALIVP